MVAPGLACARGDLNQEPRLLRRGSSSLVVVADYGYSPRIEVASATRSTASR
jgi:hypothetical protein